jgi:soluble cytochrome b562
VRDERIYHEYANWKLENHELLKYLTDSNSDLMIRFKHVIDVTDHLYDKLIDDTKYTDEEDKIFESGFYYLFDQIDEISQLLNKSYQNNIKDLEDHAKDVNLLLSTIDFQNELMTVEDFEQGDLDKLVEFEEYILDVLKKKEVVPHDKFLELDKITFEIFNKLDVEYFPVNDIFLEIADELGLL